MIATYLTWLGLAGGLLPMTWFLAQFRPSWPIKSPAYLFAGLLLAVWLGYVRIAAVLAVRGWTARIDTWVDGVLSIVPLLVIDWMVIALLLTFRRYRAEWLDAVAKRDREES